MSVLLKVVGGLWALIGVADIVYLPGWGTTGHETIQAVGLIFNFVIFVFPGLALCGIGASLGRRTRTT